VQEHVHPGLAADVVEHHHVPLTHSASTTLPNFRSHLFKTPSVLYYAGMRKQR
jgi:hypothetical protein